MSVDLRCGAWQDVLADVECDALISDPPYGQRAHEGHDDATDQVLSVTGQKTRRSLGYWYWTPADVAAFVEHWAPRTRGWIACMTSHDLIPAYEEAYRAAGRYAFAPVPIFQKRPRLVGDGPANWTVYLLVARPRNVEYARWGCLPGHYESSCERNSAVVGAKPIKLMREICRDYSRPGEIVCDPCSGGASTLIAARLEGRSAIGAEADEDTWRWSSERLADIKPAAGGQTSLFAKGA